MNAPDVVQRPFAGHLIVADDCRFFRTTDVGGQWRISTIGDYYPKHMDGKRDTIGYNRYFETMVFRIGDDSCSQDCGGPCAGAPLVSDWTEQDFEGYQTAAEAEAGHGRMVQKYVDSLAVTAS